MIKQEDIEREEGYAPKSDVGDSRNYPSEFRSDSEAQESNDPVNETSAETEAGEDTVQATDLKQGEDDRRAWYVIHCYSGYENKVRYNLEQRIETMGVKDKIFDVVIPTQRNVDISCGERIDSYTVW